MRRLASSSLFIGLMILSSCSSHKSGWFGGREISSKTKRGLTHDYDPGPDKDGKLAKLFANTPNYRAYGQKIIGGRGEKFRWKFGPMWYRGRLGNNEVKVFVIGQEGAQDENVSNRSFTGSTGTKMQKFINHLGINQSYLYMNTFVYTITGQYSLFGEDRENQSKVEQQKNLLKLAQSPRSLVVKHRHQMFDTVLKKNKDLSLVIGVGTAGKDSAATYANHLTGSKSCSNRQVGNGGCLVQHPKTGKGILFVGVPHPGGASPRNGGESALTRLLTSFDKQAQIVLKAIEARKIQLSTDPGAKRASSSAKYRYGNAPVPHMDFTFGTNWRMGQSGTSSNRRGSHTIQVFSKNGCYNNTKKGPNNRCTQATDHSIKYNDPVDLISKAPKEMAPCDVPYESPKGCTDAYKEFDPGPGSKKAKVMLNWFESIKWPELGITQHMSFGPQGFYRGDLNDPEILVIADQHAHDDMFSGRALTGEAGQRLQSSLNSSRKSYAIIRTLPVDSLDLGKSKRGAIINHPKVAQGRDKLIKAVLGPNTKMILGVGPFAQKIAKQLASQLGLEFKGISSSALKKMKLTIIPRKDLPSHTRWWMGTSGSRAARAYRQSRGSKAYSGDYYKMYAPRWATKWSAGRL